MWDKSQKEGLKWWKYWCTRSCSCLEDDILWTLGQCTLDGKKGLFMYYSPSTARLNLCRDTATKKKANVVFERSHDAIPNKLYHEQSIMFFYGHLGNEDLMKTRTAKPERFRNNFQMESGNSTSKENDELSVMFLRISFGSRLFHCLNYSSNI